MDFRGFLRHASGGMAAPNEQEPVFDAEPVRELAPGEPVTPMWLPLVGVALFGLAALYLLVRADASSAGGAAASASASSSVAIPTPALAPTIPPQMPTGASRDQIRDIRQNLLQARERQQPGAAAPPPPGAVRVPPPGAPPGATPPGPPKTPPKTP
ncbi:MAG TPA: hypothetical protein VFB62_25430 [Polyangiaceae bacterium]|jgi:hypothetical protein|nr:hypothetical protein [Polyangiaceae bacterium]